MQVGVQELALAYWLIPHALVITFDIFDRERGAKQCQLGRDVSAVVVEDERDEARTIPV